MKTKKQKREELLKAALRQRVADIANGSAGYDFDAEGEFATASFLERFIPALELTFGYERKVEHGTVSNSYLFKAHNLAHFNEIDSTTDFLFESGVRA